MDDLPALDAHAHVWDQSCQYVPDSRYRPAYQAPIETYLGVLDAHAIERAVLVQPSFLGSDNRYLLAALAAHPDRLRGIVVVQPDITDGRLDELQGAGVIGVRYNLLSMPVSVLGTGPWRALTERVAARGWWVEVQATGPDWPLVLPHLRDARLMVDHFGRPANANCPGLAALAGRDPATTCVKLSAPYRQMVPDLPAVARRLIRQFGAGRCLWGSDWPWTQHEAGRTYRACRNQLSDWTTAEDRLAMKRAAPALTGFSPP